MRGEVPHRRAGSLGVGGAGATSDGRDCHGGGIRGEPVSRQWRPRAGIAQPAQPSFAGRTPDLLGLEGTRCRQRRRGLLQEADWSDLGKSRTARAPATIVVRWNVLAHRPTIFATMALYRKLR